MLAPERIWWKPLHSVEKRWVIIAFLWCITLAAMMPLWLIYGRQNVPAETLRTTPQEYMEKVTAFTEQYQVDVNNGVPIVAPPADSDIYVLARQWQWYPQLQLEKGETYRLHLSSLDVQHGFSLQPVNLNLQILPEYEYIATITPTQSGEFSIVCNEFCEIGHHLMVGKIFVND